MRPGRMTPFVVTTEARAALGSAAQDGATQAMVSPTTSTSPANAMSGVTTMPFKRILSTAPTLSSVSVPTGPPEQTEIPELVVDDEDEVLLEVEVEELLEV